MACVGELPGWLYKTCPDNSLDNFLYNFINYIFPIIILSAIVYFLHRKFKSK